MEEENKSFQKFIELVQDQFQYGGQKYALSSDNRRESTDILFDIHGKNWLFGTIHKYIFRFRNLARERDLLKIGTYMFILWLKRGFWIMLGGIFSPPIDTNLKVKNEQFGLFVQRANEHKEWTSFYNKRVKDIEGTIGIGLRKSEEEFIYTDGQILDLISKKLEEFSNVLWKEVPEQDILLIFWLCCYLWERNYSDTKEHDTDTYNKKKEE